MTESGGWVSGGAGLCAGMVGADDPGLEGCEGDEGLGWDTDVQPDVSLGQQVLITENPFTFDETSAAKNDLSNGKTSGGDGLISEI
eukprot:12363926-Karenia_brevis.AAC.1